MSESRSDKFPIIWGSFGAGLICVDEQDLVWVLGDVVIPMRGVEIRIANLDSLELALQADQCSDCAADMLTFKYPSF